MSSALIYKMRLTAPNKPGTASHNSNYVKYIAEREHVMKLSPESESGLFGRIDGTNNDELDVTDTQNYVYGISKAGVTVYNAYISFRPEIAKRLELDSLEKWQNYIKFHIETLMRGYDIPKDRFEYIAAVHDKKGQPHIHISFWDKDPPVTVQFVVLLPYKFTLLSNPLTKLICGIYVLLPYKFTLLSNLSTSFKWV